MRVRKAFVVKFFYPFAIAPTARPQLPEFLERARCGRRVCRSHTLKNTTSIAPSRAACARLVGTRLCLRWSCPAALHARQASHAAMTSYTQASATPLTRATGGACRSHTLKNTTSIAPSRAACARLRVEVRCSRRRVCCSGCTGQLKQDVALRDYASTPNAHGSLPYRTTRTRSQSARGREAANKLCKQSVRSAWGAAGYSCSRH